MLYFLAVWTFIAVVCLTIGFALLNACQADSLTRSGDRFVLALWLGIVALCLTLLGASLAVPVSFAVGLAIALGLAALSLLSRPVRLKLVAFGARLSPRLLGGWLALQLGIAFLTAEKITWIDTGLYHLGVIRWLADYGVVPGAALIHSRFGWNSSWFALAAALNPEFVSYRASAAANGFILCVTIAHFLIGLKRIGRGKSCLSDWFATVAYAILLPMLLLKALPLGGGRSVMAEILISPSPDIPVTLLIVLTAWSMLLISESARGVMSDKVFRFLDVSAIPLLLAVGAVTMKLTALPLAVVASLFYFARGGWRLPRVFWGSLAVLLLLAPLLGINIVTSSCPLSPSKFLCLDLPWSETKPLSGNLGLWWKSEGLIGFPPPKQNYWLWFLPQWLQQNKLNAIMALLNVLALVLGVRLHIKIAKFNLINYLWLLLIGVLGIAVILTQAPDIRYGLGYFIIIPSLVFGAYFKLLYTSEKTTISQQIYSLFQILQNAVIFQKSRFFFLVLSGFATICIVGGIAQSRLLLPPELPAVKLMPAKVNDVSYFYPIEPKLCWATEMPCALGPLKNIKLRHPPAGIRGGFVRLQFIQP